MAARKKKAAAKKKHDRGRPGQRTSAMAKKICEALVHWDGSVGSLVDSDPEMPSSRFVYYWLDDDEKFMQQYTHAKELQATRFLGRDYRRLNGILSELSPSEDGSSEPHLKGLRGEFEPGMINAIVGHAKATADCGQKLAGMIAHRKYSQRMKHEQGVDPVMAD